MKTLKVKRKAKKHITNYTNGNIHLQFKGKGPFEIRADHFPFVQDFFEEIVIENPEKKQKEKKNALP